MEYNLKEIMLQFYTYGLCTNLEMWTLDRELYLYDTDRYLDKSFASKGLDTSFPFNYGGNDYNEELDNNTIFKNPARLAFIKSRLKNCWGGAYDQARTT